MVREGGTEGAIWVFVSGALSVRKGAVAVNRITQPGALVGEITALLGSAYGATTKASAPSLLPHAAGGRALLASHPDIAWAVARGLAERLNFVTTCLAGLKHQYGDAPGLAVVPQVLRELAQRQGPPPASRSISM